MAALRTAIVVIGLALIPWPRLDKHKKRADLSSGTWLATCCSIQRHMRRRSFRTRRFTGTGKRRRCSSRTAGLKRIPRFTISGRPNDTPVSYREGRRMIRGTALTILQYSVVNNVSAGIGSRLLETRYPSHKKLIRALSWIERIGFASFVTYRNSADHIRQARTNHRLAREHGYIAP